MLEQNKNPISPLVAGQLPDFVKIDHPTLNSFLSAYYEWLDKDTTYLRSPKRLNEVIDIDTTMDEFVAKFKNEFLFDFPETLAELDDGTTVDASKLVKNIKSFYKAKGTEKTYDFLFRILYDTGVEFYYPKKDILKLSHGKWILKKTIKLSNFLGSTIFDSIGETVKQRNSQGEITASGRVMDATTYRVGIYEIAELSLGGINGAFDVAKGEVEFTDNYGNVRKENRIFPVIGEVTVTTAGSGYLLGDRVVLTPAAGDTGLNALGRVSEISSTGGVKKVMMYNLGVNYKVSPTISIISELGKDFSGTVSVSAQANYAGYYANSDGKLGSNKVIQDNHYYQDFSYVMLAEITIDRYRDVIKKLLNPAGMAFFGKILLKRCAAAELNQSTALAQYEVPLIGNYLPYTFITNEDLSKWFVKTTTVNGKVQTTIDGYNRNMQESVIRNDYTRDGIVDGQDYEQWLSMHPQDASTEKQFIQKIGNPFASQNVNPGTDGNPLLREGSTEHPFWIVYQHPNRKVADTVVARIPYGLKNDFLSNRGALALTGSENFPWDYSTNIEGPWPEWNESTTAGREYWTTEFTEGDRYVSLSYNPLVPLYQNTPGSDGLTGLSVYKNTTSTVYGNPTNLYDSFVVDGRDWSKEQLEALGPSFVGGKRCYKFTETELNLPTNRTTESIVNSLETWLYSQGFNRTTQEYVILKLNQENTLEMIQVLKGIKRLFPEAKFGYYDYPKIPSFVLVIEQQYNSFEYLSDASRNTIIENTTNSIYDLIKEQDLIVLDMHFSSPSLAKMKVLAAAKIKVADKLNEKLVAEGLRRKVVIAATSRIWKTNSNETPTWVRSNELEIAQGTRDQYYIPEYSVVKPSTFINTFKDIIGTVAGESRFIGNGYRTINGYYNDLDPQFLLQAALGSTHADYVNSIYNDVPPVLNTGRSINTDSYQTLIRKSLSTYVNYSKGVTGSTEFYSATGATANNWHYNYWFPLVNKKISSIPSAYYPEIKTDILYNAIYPIYYKFNYLISMAYSAAGQTAGGVNLSGNLLGSWPTSDVDSPEVTTLLGDLDGSGYVDTGDMALILLNWGENSTLNPQYRYDAPWTKTDGEVILPTSKLLGYKIAYSDFRKITARSFFEMPVGREFNCTTDEITAPPVPVVFAAKINGSAYPLQANYDHTDPSNLVTGGENLVLTLEAERGITGTPTEGISSLVYLGYYGVRSLWAELYAVKPSEAGYGEIEYQIANAGPFKPTSSIISINTPFPNFENPNTTNEMFTANYRISDSSSFKFGGVNIVKNNFFMRLKLVFRNGSNSAVPNATKVMDFNYNRT